MRHLTKLIPFLFGLLFIGACTAKPAAAPDAQRGTPVAPQPAAALANPASENCVAQGGFLSIQKRGDGGEYGVCLFEDNRQCEEWALLRGECPVGGLKVTGYITAAAQYCVITGGTYEITSASASGEEAGVCILKNGQTCDAAEYFDGKCDPGAVTGGESFSDPFAYCTAVGTIDAPDGRYTGPGIPDAVVQALIQQEIVAADAPSEFQQSAVWRCMDGKVWACHFGANLPCQEKADLSREPTPEMEDFCRTEPDAEFIPAAAAGRATVYEWKCTAGKPEVVRQVLQADAQGYLADFWYELAPK